MLWRGMDSGDHTDEIEAMGSPADEANGNRDDGDGQD
jgi:hypothetical protein